MYSPPVIFKILINIGEVNINLSKDMAGVESMIVEEKAAISRAVDREKVISSV